MSSTLLAGPGQSAVAAPVAVPAAEPVATPVVVPLDSGDKLVVNPVVKGGVVATFSKAYRLKKRPVELQSSTTGTDGWVKVKTVKMTSKGIATFNVEPSDTAYYRAVAKVYKKKKTPVATPVVASSWVRDRYYDFSTGAALNAEWAPRLSGSFTTKGRQCSAPQASNSVIGGGIAALKLDKEKDAAVIAAATPDCQASLKAAYSGKTLKKMLKASTIYRNAMLSTEGRYTVSTGIVAAKVKFPKNRGMHAGVWLQSNGGPEIDMIESYGYGKGITNVYHLQRVTATCPNGKATTTCEYKVYKKNTKKSWWKSWHVFSVEWTTTKMIFRMDGQVTKSVTRTTPQTDYFLVMSLLSSDWELNKMNGKLPATMSVDWIKIWTPKA